MEKGTTSQGNSQVDSPHYGLLRSCAGCPWGAIWHLGCVVNDNAQEVLQSTPINNPGQALPTAPRRG